MATLRRSDPPHRLTPTELMRSSMVTSGAITQRLDKLEGRGLVARSSNAADGRGVLVALTEEGRKLIEAALPDHLATEQRLLSVLSKDERTELAETLRRLLESLSG